MRLAYASSPNSADASRYTLALALEARGEYQEAIDQLRAMHSFGRNTTANLMVSRLGSKLRDAEIEAARRRVEAASPPESAKDKEEP